MKTTIIHARVSPETQRQLDALAAHWGESESDALRRCISETYVRLEDKMNHNFDYNDFCKLFGQDVEPDQMKDWTHQDYVNYITGTGMHLTGDVSDVDATASAAMEFVQNY